MELTEISLLWLWTGEIRRIFGLPELENRRIRGILSRIATKVRF